MIPNPYYFDYEFLYGIRRDIQQKMLSSGFKVRVYVPFGDDWWPYGIERSRTTLEAFLLYGYEQGTLHKKMKPEDPFPEEVQHFFKY